MLAWELTCHLRTTDLSKCLLCSYRNHCFVRCINLSQSSFLLLAPFINQTHSVHHLYLTNQDCWWWHWVGCMTHHVICVLRTGTQYQHFCHFHSIRCHIFESFKRFTLLHRKMQCTYWQTHQRTLFRHTKFLFKKYREWSDWTLLNR